jgi:hypothetical protein
MHQFAEYLHGLPGDFAVFARLVIRVLHAAPAGTAVHTARLTVLAGIIATSLAATLALGGALLPLGAGELRGPFCMSRHRLVFRRMGCVLLQEEYSYCKRKGIRSGFVAATLLSM